MPSPRSAAQRAKSKGIPPAPKDLASIDFSVLETPTRRIFDSIVVADKDSGIVIFGTETTMTEFVESKVKSMDGTFRIAPKLYYQVLIIMAMVSGTFIPCFFVLLPSKTRDIYNRLFMLLSHAMVVQGHRADFRDHHVMCDFEHALRAAFKVEKLYIQRLQI